MREDSFKSSHYIQGESECRNLRASTTTITITITMNTNMTTTSMQDMGTTGTMDTTMMNTSTIMTMVRMDTGTNMAESMPTCTATKRGCALCKFQQQGCFS